MRQKLGSSRQAPAKQQQHHGGGDDDHVVIEVKETTPDDVGGLQQQDQRALAIERLQQETEDAESPIRPRQPQPQPRAPADAGPRVAPWEVRAEAPRPGGGEDQVENPDGETKKPVSRAERRRLIKAEIDRLASGEQPVYYQRRLW